MRHLLLLCLILVVIVVANASPRRQGKGKGRKGVGEEQGGKGKGKGKFSGMTREERKEFMKQWIANKDDNRKKWGDKITKWRNENKMKGKRRKQGDEDLPENFYTALVDGKPQMFRGIMKSDKPDLQAEPEEVEEKPKSSLKSGKSKVLSGKSKGPKADGATPDDFDQVSRKGRRKTLKRWQKKNLAKWEERQGKRKGKGRQWKVKQKGKGRNRPESENEVTDDEAGEPSRKRGKGKGKGKGRRGRRRRETLEQVRVKRAETYTQQDKLWPSPHITYVFGASFGSSYRLNMRKAMDMWESKSCLKFTEARSAPTDDEPYIFIDTIDMNSCWADRLGIKKDSPYKTTINAGWCRTEVGSLAHELGHVLGLAHSQKRTDRDEHIKVYMDKIDFDWRSQYEKNKGYTYDDYGIPYYYESLMHYPPTYNGDTVICALDPLTEIRMGQRAKITFKDFAFINKLYCEEECLSEYEMASTDFEGSTLSQTISGLVCQTWGDNSPHSHDYNHVGKHNYCRNPDKWDAGPWCYTTDDNVRYEPCISSCQKLDKEQVPSCQGYCHNGGFFDDMCQCQCPSYASGEHCQVINLKEKYSFLQCGGKIELDTDGNVQSIESQSYPNQYPENHLCKWWIQAPVGMYVAMEVVDFDVEAPSGASCRYDYVQIELSNCPEVPQRPDDIRYCGLALKADDPLIEVSKTRDLIITFRSDGSVQHNGFKFEFHAFK